jgi:MFS family permease
LILLLDETKISSGAKKWDSSRFDVVGATLSTIGLLLLLLALSNGQRMGWTSAPIVSGVVGSAIVICGFILWELRVSSPMLDLNLFAMRTVTFGTIARGMFMFATASIGFLMPFYLQGVVGLPASRAALFVMTSGIAMVLVSPFGGALSDRYGRRLFMLIGLGFVALGFCVLALAIRFETEYLVLVGLGLQGVGMGLFISPNLGAILSDVEEGQRGVTTALVNLVRTASNLIGVAVAATIVSGIMLLRGFEPKLDITTDVSQGAAGAFAVGTQIAFWAMAAVCVFGAVMSSFASNGRNTPRT